MFGILMSVAMSSTVPRYYQLDGDSRLSRQSSIECHPMTNNIERVIHCSIAELEVCNVLLDSRT